MTKFLLGLFSLGAIFSSIFVITSKNPVIAMIFLISLFMNMALYLIWANIGFVGLSYILIYIGAITVLFLFIIMMINIRLVDILETGYQYTKNLPLAIFVGTLFIFVIFSTLPFTFNNVFLLSLPLEYIQLLNGVFMDNNYFLSINNIFDNVQLNSYTDVISQNLIQIKILGQGLYTYGAIWLLLSGIILLLAMLSAIILSKKI